MGSDILYLKKPNLLTLVLDDLHKTIVREDDTLLALTVINGLRFVKNFQPTSGNLIINADTRTGKDYIVKEAYAYLTPETRNIHRVRISETAFTYWHANEQGWTWDGKQLHLEDINSDILNCEVMRTMTSNSGGIATIVKKQKAVDLVINGKPLVTCTAYNLGLNEEITNRFSIMDMDDSSEQTQYIKEFKSLKRMGTCTLAVNEALKKEYQKVLSANPVDVVVPFSDKLNKYLPNITTMRTITDRLNDYISASAAIHRYQRDNVNEKIIATYDDYFFGRLTFMKTHATEQCVPLSMVDRSVIYYVQESATGATAKELRDNVQGVTSYYCYNGLPRLVKSGLLFSKAEYTPECHKTVPHFYYASNMQISLPLMPDGVPIDPQLEEALLDLSKNQKTNQKTNTPVESSSILVLCYLLKKYGSCNITLDLTKKPKERGYSTPYSRYFGRYFGFMTDDDVKELQDMDWSV